MSDEITIQESARLVTLEKTIQRGLSNFIEVGEALAEVRDTYKGRFDKLGYKNFEDYCQVKWGLKQTHAYRMMDAAAAVASLKSSPIGELPAKESQARPLTKLSDPAQQREAWSCAVESSKTGKPTAREVEVAVERVRALPETKFTAEQEAAAEDAEKDSETLWLLKSYWKKATKKDRKAFLIWAEDKN